MSMADETTDGEINPLEAVGEAAGAAFQEALADGATPEDAFTTAAAVATQAANDLGISPEISGPVTEAAQSAFDATIADGATPEDAFETAGDAAGETYGEPIEVIGAAAGEAFNQAVEDGATPEGAFSSATVVASETASDYGFPPELVDPVIEAAQGAFDTALADGAAAQDAFDAAGDAFMEAVGAGEDTSEMKSDDMEAGTEGYIAEGGDPAMGGAEGGDGGLDALAGALGEETSGTAVAR